MNLLISTPLHIFQVNAQTGHVEPVRDGDGYFYGISCMGGRIALTHTGGYLQHYQRGTGTISTQSTLIDPHQCEWIDNSILVANTGKNCLTVFDHSGNHLRDVYLNDIHSDRKDGSRIGNHFNSVHKKDDQVYVIAHNYERQSELYSLSWPDLRVEHVQKMNANWAHNIWSGDLGLVTCNSRHGALIEVESGETLWDSNEKDALTRGLAVSRDYIFVGYSNQTIRKERFWMNGGIWVIDRKSLRTVEKILLPGSGQVHEVRVLDEKDDCHNGQIITTEMVAGIRRKSILTRPAYEVRKRFPGFQKDLPVVSQIVRARQIFHAWLRGQ